MVDAALPPDRKSSPYRALIVIGMTFLGFFVAFWGYARQALERSFELSENQRCLEAIKTYWKGKPEPA